MQNDQKSLTTAYLWWLFLGIFGAHRFYFRKRKSGFALFYASIFWILSLFVISEPFGIIVLVQKMEPLEKFLLEFGQIGRIFSATIFIILLTFPFLWWLSDAFRIPRWFKTQERPSE